MIAQAGFPAGLDRERDGRPQFRYFTGAAGEFHLAITPDQLISEPTPLTVGGIDLVLYPAAGGETGDALLVHLPASGVLFAGDGSCPISASRSPTKDPRRGCLRRSRSSTGCGHGCSSTATRR